MHIPGTKQPLLHHSLKRTQHPEHCHVRKNLQHRLWGDSASQYCMAVPQPCMVFPFMASQDVFRCILQPPTVFSLPGLPQNPCLAFQDSHIPLLHYSLVLSPATHCILASPVVQTPTAHRLPLFSNLHTGEATAIRGSPPYLSTPTWPVTFREVKEGKEERRWGGSRESVR